MTDDTLPCPLKVIGHAHTRVADADIARSRRHLESDIVLLPQYAAGLTGIEVRQKPIRLIDRRKDCLLYTSPSPRD